MRQLNNLTLIQYFKKPQLQLSKHNSNMQQNTLPLLRSSVSRKLKTKRGLSQPPLRSVTEQCGWQPSHHVSLIQEINRAKNKVHMRKTAYKTNQIASLQDSIDQNKKFNRQLKFFIHRSKNPELINVICKKKEGKIPKFQYIKESSFEHERAVQNLKRRVQPKWKIYAKKRPDEGFSLRDSFLSLKDNIESKSVVSLGNIKDNRVDSVSII